MEDCKCDCSIDPDALDIEWLEQPNTFLFYAEAMANARLEMDRAKEQMDVTKAQVDTEIRRGHALSGTKPKERLTETQISNLVIQDRKYRDTVDIHIQSKHNFEILSARVKALEQRKVALENLVRLNGQQYFASPIEPRNLSLEYAKNQMLQKEKDTARSRLIGHMKREQ